MKGNEISENDRKYILRALHSLDLRAQDAEIVHRAIVMSNAGGVSSSCVEAATGLAPKEQARLMDRECGRRRTLARAPMLLDADVTVQPGGLVHAEVSRT